MKFVRYALLALAGLVVLVSRRRPADLAMAGLLAGALAFAASFFVISISCDYRYLYLLDLAALAGTPLHEMPPLVPFVPPEPGVAPVVVGVRSAASRPAAVPRSARMSASRRSMPITRCPACSSLALVARPIPEADPVTTTVRWLGTAVAS